MITRGRHTQEAANKGMGSLNLKNKRYHKRYTTAPSWVPTGISVRTILYTIQHNTACMLYTSDPAYDRLVVDISGANIIKKNTGMDRLEPSKDSHHKG